MNASNPSGTENSPECFGVPEVVHSKDEEGFSQPRPECVACPHLRPCLQTALRREGVLPAKTLSDAPARAVSKVSGFIRRWSDRKLSGSDRV